MDRRRFLVGGLCALSAPGVAAAQGRGRARIGVITFGFAPTSAPLEAFRRALRELGYGESGVLLEYRFAEGRADRLPSLVAELLNLKPDIIVTEGTPTALEVKRATQSIPVVTAVVSDPVGLGLVPSLARPGGNFTGLTISVADRTGKQLQLIKEVLPQAKTVGVLHNAANQLGPQNMRDAEAAARALGIILRVVGVKSPTELDEAFRKLTAERQDAFASLGDGMLWGNRKRIVDFAARNRLPAVFPEREFAEDGGLLAYGPDVAANFRRAATYVDKILKGAKPADLPIEQPTKLELVINLRTAAALGLKVPGTVLVRADELIQ